MGGGGGAWLERHHGDKSNGRDYRQGVKETLRRPLEDRRQKQTQKHVLAASSRWLSRHANAAAERALVHVQRPEHRTGVVT